MTFDNRSSYTTREPVNRENQLRQKVSELEATVRQQAGRFVYVNARMKKLERVLKAVGESGTITEAHEHVKRGLGRP